MICFTGSYFLFIVNVTVSRILRDRSSIPVKRHGKKIKEKIREYLHSHGHSRQNPDT
jgi:hypothetical protein